VSPTVHILSRNHFDNTWRRCWDRPYEYGGRRCVGYVTVERAVTGFRSLFSRAASGDPEGGCADRR